MSELVGICLQCGGLETHRAILEFNGRLPTDHECAYTPLPVEHALRLAATFDAENRKNDLPRCADCGIIPVVFYSPTEEKGRCPDCARSNWKKIWSESVQELLEPVTEVEIENANANANADANADANKATNRRGKKK